MLHLLATSTQTYTISLHCFPNQSCSQTAFGTIQGGCPLPPPPPPLPPPPPRPPLPPLPAQHGGLVVAAAVGLSGYTAASFDARAKSSFSSAWADLLPYIEPADVVITAVTDWVPAGGRHLLTSGVQVAFIVNVWDTSEIVYVNATIVGKLTTDTATLLRTLTSWGLSNATAITQTMAPVVLQPPPGPPSAARRELCFGARIVTLACIFVLAVVASV